MTITKYALTFVDDATKLPAAFANKVNDDLVKCADWVDGGDTKNPTTANNFAGDKISLTGTTNIALASRSITRHQSMAGGFTTSGNWTERSYGVWRNTASGGVMEMALDDLPSRGTLTAVYMRWVGASGHGALPTLPNFELFRVDEDGAATSLGTATDGSGSVGAYEVAHDVSLTGLSEALDGAAQRYWITVTGELGGNFVANSEMVSLRAVVTVTQYNEW